MSFIMSYDKAFHKSFHAKLESLQYNATLTITGAIKGCSTQKIYQELGLESLKSWYFATEKWVFCMEFSKVNHRHIFLILYQITIRNSKREIQATVPLSLLNMIILRILFPSAI